MKYPTINGWTKQRIIDHIKTNFKGKSVSKKANGEQCMYRGPNGKKCGVGLFIPDDKYHPDLDNAQASGGTSAYHVLTRHVEIQQHMPLNIDEMGKFQRIHDGSVSDEGCLSNMLNWIERNVQDSTCT